MMGKSLTARSQSTTLHNPKVSVGGSMDLLPDPGLTQTLLSINVRGCVAVVTILVITDQHGEKLFPVTASLV